MNSVETMKAHAKVLREGGAPHQQELAEAIDEVLACVANINDNVDGLLAQRDAARADVAALRAERDELSPRLEAEKKRADEAGASLTGHAREIVRLSQALKAAEYEIENKRQDRDEARKALEAEKAHSAELQKQLDNADIRAGAAAGEKRAGLDIAKAQPGTFRDLKHEARTGEKPKHKK